MSDPAEVFIERCILFMLAGIIFCLGGAVGCWTGVPDGRMQMIQQAVSEGHAEWYLDANNEKRWRWKKIPPRPTGGAVSADRKWWLRSYALSLGPLVITWRDLWDESMGVEVTWRHRVLFRRWQP